MRSSGVRPGQEVIVDLGTTGAWLVELCTDDAARKEGARERRVDLQPVAYAPDGQLLVGEPARGQLVEAPLSGVSEWLDRIGDDVPIVLDGRAVTPEDLLARVLRSHVGDAVDALRLVVPASWGPHRQAQVQDALRRVGMTSVRVIAAPLATVQAPGLELPDTGRVLVVDAGDRRTSASLVDLDGPDGPQLVRAAAADLGGSDIDEGLLDFVRPRLVGPVADGDALLRACRSARERLSLAPAAELHPPGAEPLRLVRAELDSLVGDRLRSTVAALLDRIGRGAADAVVLVGGLARMPLLVEILSALVDRPVQVPADPGLAAVRGAARVTAPPVLERTELSKTALLAAVPAGEDDPTERLEAQPEPGLSAQGDSRERRGLLVPLRRYGGLASAAATIVVVLSAPLAFPGLNLGLGAGSSQQQASGSLVAESRSASDRESTGAGQAAADTRPGPLRIVADLLTPSSAAAQERTPRESSAQESPGPLRALADRLASATPSGRPSTSSAGAERSTSPTSATSSKARTAAAPTSEAPSRPAEQTQTAEAPETAKAPEAQPTAAEPTSVATNPVRTPVPAPATTSSAPEPTTAPPTSQAPAPQPEPTTAPPAPEPPPSEPAPAPDPVPEPASSTTSTTSSAPDPGPSETLNAGAL